MDDRDELLKRRLDEVVGTRYHEARDIPERIRVGWPKWVLGALFAILAACLVVLLIERHRLPPDGKVEAVKKPVVVRILPPPAAPPSDSNRR